MAYASLTEAYDLGFAKQVNKLHPAHKRKRNPIRNHQSLPGARYNEPLSRNQEHPQRLAEIQSQQDQQIHQESFRSQKKCSPFSPEWREQQIMGDFRPWGNSIERKQLSQKEQHPQEYLKRSLIGEKSISGYPPGTVGEYRATRGRQNPGISDQVTYKPSGKAEYIPFDSFNLGGGRARGYVDDRITYSRLPTVKSGSCQKYFNHLDNCLNCRNRLKKRVLMYMRSLQDSGTPLLPGARGKEFYSPVPRDSIDDMLRLEPEKKEEKQEVKEEKKETETKEHFSQPKQFYPAILLMLFGLLVIFVLDSSRKVMGKGIKIVET